jgi:hypothetical protein
VVNTSDGKIITVFIAGVRDNRCRKELRISEPTIVSELYALVDKCVRAEQGRLAPERAAQAANDPMPLDKKKGTRKRASKQVLAAEPGPSATADKKVKPDAPEAVDATPA